MSSPTSTTPSTQIQHSSKLSVTGRISGRKCVARYSRNRRRPGQKKGEDYMRNIRMAPESPAITITNLYLTKMKDLDRDAQAELTFRMWDILAGAQIREDDAIKTQIICAPHTVPDYIKKDVTTRELYIDTDQCPYCLERSVVVIDIHGEPSCTACGAALPPTLHFETPFAKGDGRKEEQAHFTVVHKHIYDRMAHFKALMNNIQGLGRSKLCPTMIAMLLQAVSESPSPYAIDHSWVARHLKLNKQGKYIPQAVRLASLANPFFTTPTLDMNQLDQLEMGFVEVCDRFDEWITSNKHVKRKNFMSYPYIAHQLFIRVGLPHLCQYLNMIKSDVRLDAQNKMWEILCANSGWAFKAV